MAALSPVQWVAWLSGFLCGVAVGVPLSLVAAYLVGRFAAKPVAPAATARPPITKGEVREAVRHAIGTRQLDVLVQEIRQENEAIDIWNESNQPGGRA